MKKLLTGFLLCFFSILHAQTNAIQNALKNYDYELAIQLISKEKKSVDMDFLKAKCYKNIAQYKSAIVLLEEIVRQNPTNISAVNELAESYQLSGNYSKSKFFYFMALQSAPNNRFAQLNYMNSMFKLREWKSTIKFALPILKKDSLPVLYPILGDCYLQVLKPDSSIYFYRKALKNNSEDYNTLSKLSNIYLLSSDYDALLKCTTNYMQTDSSNQVINQYNGIGHCMKKNHPQAIYRLNKLYQQGDSSFITHFYLGISYFANNDNPDAYFHLKQALKKDSSNVTVYYYLGKASILSGHQPEGIAYLHKGINKITPKDSVLYNYNYAIAKGYEFGNNTERLKYLKLCSKLKPEQKSLLYIIAGVYDNELKKPEEALNYYNLFMATRPTTELGKSQSGIGSYYNATEYRIKEIKEELDTKKEKKK